MDFAHRCLEKARIILEEVMDEDKHHPYKQTVAIWETLEQIIRAVIYAYRRVTYEKPQKLISMLPRFVKKARNKELIATIQKVYSRRRGIVHKPRIPKKQSLEKIKSEFCHAARRLLSILKEKGYEDVSLNEKIEAFCGERESL